MSAVWALTSQHVNVHNAGGQGETLQGQARGQSQQQGQGQQRVQDPGRRVRQDQAAAPHQSQWYDESSFSLTGQRTALSCVELWEQGLHGQPAVKELEAGTLMKGRKRKPSWRQGRAQAFDNKFSLFKQLISTLEDVVERARSSQPHLPPLTLAAAAELLDARLKQGGSRKALTSFLHSHRFAPEAAAEEVLEQRRMHPAQGEQAGAVTKAAAAWEKQGAGSAARAGVADARTVGTEGDAAAGMQGDKAGEAAQMEAEENGTRVGHQGAASRLAMHEEEPESSGYIFPSAPAARSMGAAQRLGQEAVSRDQKSPADAQLLQAQAMRANPGAVGLDPASTDGSAGDGAAPVAGPSAAAALLSPPMLLPLPLAPAAVAPGTAAASQPHLSEPRQHAQAPQATGPQPLQRACEQLEVPVHIEEAEAAAGSQHAGALAGEAGAGAEAGPGIAAGARMVGEGTATGGGPGPSDGSPPSWGPTSSTGCREEDLNILGLEAPEELQGHDMASPAGQVQPAQRDRSMPHMIWHARRAQARLHGPGAAACAAGSQGVAPAHGQGGGVSSDQGAREEGEGQAGERGEEEQQRSLEGVGAGVVNVEGAAKRQCLVQHASFSRVCRAFGIRQGATETESPGGARKRKLHVPLRVVTAVEGPEAAAAAAPPAL